MDHFLARLARSEAATQQAPSCCLSTPAWTRAPHAGSHWRWVPTACRPWTTSATQSRNQAHRAR
eukprot:690695-Prymnesium_polylepis.1